MSGTLSLAASIAAMDRASIEALLIARSPASTAVDPLALAAELLKADSISRALTALPRELLDALQQDSPLDPEALERLRSLGLVGMIDEARVRLPEVTAALTAALAGAPAPMQPSPGPALAEPDTSHWYAAALTSVAHAAECLRAIDEHPGRLNRNGSLAVATVRSIAESTGLTELEAASSLQALHLTGLTTASDRALVPSSCSDHWLSLPHPERWVALAECTVAATPTPLHSMPGDSLAATVAALPHRYPLLPRADLAAAQAFADTAEHQGLTVQGRLTEAASALQRGERALALSIAERDMPPPAPGIYVQPDLSVIVPGPLAPSDEAMVAALSLPERVGVASTRRITEHSLASAFERGLTHAEAREAFARLSLTDMPQPLDYLLNAVAERVGSIVVTDHAGEAGRTLITVAKPGIADALLADRALHHLQLQRESPTALRSRLHAAHVLTALSDARHPASRAPERGAPISQTARRAPQEAHSCKPAGGSVGAHADVADATERIYRAAREQPSDFTRRIELAIRDRTTVRVTVTAQREQRQLTVLPMSLAAGRLRALDEAAGVEHTLPVSTITAVD